MRLSLRLWALLRRSLLLRELLAVPRKGLRRMVNRPRIRRCVATWRESNLNFKTDSHLQSKADSPVEAAQDAPAVETIEIGGSLPNLTLKNEKGEDVPVAELAADKGVVFFLVPKADTRKY